jgi:hypothetical protein
MTCVPKLATRPEEYLGEKDTWDQAEAQLRAALDKTGESYTIDEGGGNFYGPKIDFDVTDAIGANGSARRFSSITRCRSGSTSSTSGPITPSIDPSSSIGRFSAASSASLRS